MRSTALALGATVLALCMGSTAHAGTTTQRPIGDWTANNPDGFNFIGNTFLLNIGWNPHGFPYPGTDTPELINPDVWDGVDPFAKPGGFKSILALVNGTTSTSGRILQTVEDDGGVRLDIEVNVKNSPMSVYWTYDVLTPGHGCSLSPLAGGEGCYTHKDEDGTYHKEPEAILGQDADGSWTYSLHVILDYTPDAVTAAGGDLADGINPTIPFLLPVFYGRIPGVTAEQAVWGGTGTGTFTEHAADLNLGLVPGTKGEVSVTYILQPRDWQTIPTVGPPADVSISELP